MASGLSIRFFALLMRDSAARGWTSASSICRCFKRLLDDGQLVGRIVDHEVARQADRRRLAAQQPRAEGVKRRDPHAGDLGAEERLDARPHLLRRLVGEGDREDFVGLRVAVADEVGDAAGDDARLARPRAGEDEQRAVQVQDRLALFGVEGV